MPDAPAVITEKQLMGGYVARLDAEGTLTLIKEVNGERTELQLPALASRSLFNLLRRQVVRQTLQENK